MKNRLVRRSLVVVAAALTVAAAGCGATGGADGGTQLVSSRVAPQAQQAAGIVEAAQTTGAVDTEKVAITVRTEPSGGDPSVSVTATGEIDGANGRAHLKADVSGTIGGESGDATVEAVYDGDTAYVKAPFTSDLFGGKPWVKISSPKLTQLAEQLGGGLQGDPGSFLELLEGAGGPVTTVGTEEVRGVPTRHVHVDLDVAKVLDQAAGDRRQELSDQLAAHGVDLDELASLPADAWIDDDGYVRRFSVSFDLAELSKLYEGAEATGVVTQTIELYDFDEPVDIAVPPADQVTEFDLGGLLERGNELDPDSGD
ncbi:hypothetical protein ACE2AJ_15645 [Aquihabitans daechungensis]|uniref:hypothetical protein n=1 Tax=Aquihabitans daechungensis TaxID=1052257 RepID=UPI003B9ED5CD